VLAAGARPIEDPAVEPFHAGRAAPRIGGPDLHAFALEGFPDPPRGPQDRVALGH